MACIPKALTMLPDFRHTRERIVTKRGKEVTVIMGDSAVQRV
jgi:hypothetical protein